MSKNTWFTADLHLMHRNIIKLANRPFGDIEQHDDYIIDKYNEVIARKEKEEKKDIAASKNKKKISLKGS